MSGKYILLPIDGSATSEAAARFAEDIALAEGATVLVLAVAVPLSDRDAENEAYTAAEREYLVGQVSAEAARIRSAGVEAEELVVEADSPEVGILDTVTNRSASMVVMGTHGRTGLVRAVIGSVADKIVRRSPVPVVLVPLKGED